MEFWLASVLSLATIEVIFSLILPGLVIYMTLFKTPPELKQFSWLLLIFSAVDAYGGLGGWMSFNQRTGLSYGQGLTVYISYGACCWIGSYFCFVIEMMNYAPLMFNLTLCTFNMGYRLYLLHRKAPKTRKILPILIIFAVPWIILAAHTITQYIPPDEIVPYFSLEQQEQFGNYTVFGQEIVQDFASSVMEYSVYYPFLCCVLALIFRFFIIRSIEKMGRGVSNRNYKIQKEIVWVLTIQACCPLLIFLAVLVFNLAVVANATHPIFQTLTYNIMVTTGIIDAAVSLYFIPPYRRAIRNWFRSKTTTTFVNVSASRISNTTAG